MIFNTDPNRLFKIPPNLAREWRDKLEGWLTIAVGRFFEPVFTLQMQMVDELVALEKRILASRHRAKSLLAEIPKLKANGSLGLIKLVQQEATGLRVEAEALTYTRNCILLVGDTFAAKILDPDSIKYLSAHQSSGFLNGKVGLKAEIEAAHHFFRTGHMVILNDLTNCLRMGDLTLKKDGHIRTFEVKSDAKAYFSAETFHQIMHPMIIHDFIKNDVTRFPIKRQDKPGEIKPVRLDSDIVEDWHEDIAGAIYKEIHRSRIAHVRRGKKHYFAARSPSLDELRTAVDEITAEGDWVVANVRMRVLEYPEVQPFTLWFKPYSSVEILSGDLMVLSAFEMSDLTTLFDAKGVSVRWKRQMDDLFPIELSSSWLRSANIETHGNIGDHQRLKLLYAFVSIETFVDICSFLISPESFIQGQKKLIPKSNSDPSPPTT